MSDDVLGELTANTPRRLLDDLARLGRALSSHGRARPELELYLASGPILRGRLVGIGDTRDGAIAMIATGGSPEAPSVAYVHVGQIAALTVCDASLLVKAPVSDAPAPTKLELARTVQALGEKLGRKLALAGDLTDDGRRAIALLLPLLEQTLAGIAGDDMGRAALAAIASIELGASASAQIHKDGDKLVVRAPELLTEALTAAALRERIEALL